MFTRWQKRKRKSPAFDYARETDVHIEGKPAQQQITDLGTITESAIAQRAFFWQGAMKQLGQLAKRVERALRSMARTDSELRTERDKIPH